MARSHKQPKPSAKTSNLLPAALQASAADAGNQARIEQMGPVAADPPSLLLGDDSIAPMPASPAAPKKKGLGSLLARKAQRGAVMAGMALNPGWVPGAKGKAKSTAPSAAPASADAAAAPAVDVAPEPTLDEVMARDDAELAAEHGPAVAAWLEQLGIDDTGASAKPRGYDEDHKAAATALRGARANTGFSEVGPRGKKELVADPFMYQTGAFSKDVVDALKRAGLTDLELTALTLYTSYAAYDMNDVLRGNVKDEAFIRAWLPWALHAQRALAKLPTTVRNATVSGGKIDPTREDGAELEIRDVFRGDGWSAGFAGYFHDNFRVGGQAEEKAFLSTSSHRREDFAVVREIEVSGDAGRSLVDLSVNKSEDEVLFPPGTRMQFTGIRDVTDPSAPEAIADPSAKYDKDELKDRRFVVQAKIDSAPKGADDAPRSAGGPEAAEAEAVLEQADAEKIAAALAEAPVDLA